MTFLTHLIAGIVGALIFWLLDNVDWSKLNKHAWNVAIKKVKYETLQDLYSGEIDDREFSDRMEYLDKWSNNA